MDCEAVTAAIATGERREPLAAHLAGCARCRARVELLEALGGAPPGLATEHPQAASPDAAVPGVEHPGATDGAPTVAGLRTAWARRRRRRAAAVVTTLAVAAVALLTLARPAPPAPAPFDLLAVLDDADRVAEPADPLPGEDLLALVDPGDEDPLAATEPVLDALLGDGSF
jgi:hypothetical protein